MVKFQWSRLALAMALLGLGALKGIDSGSGGIALHGGEGVHVPALRSLAPCALTFEVLTGLALLSSRIAAAPIVAFLWTGLLWGAFVSFRILGVPAARCGCFGPLRLGDVGHALVLVALMVLAWQTCLGGLPSHARTAASEV